MTSKEALEILVKQANERKLSNKIVANGIAVSVLEKLVEQAQKREKLLELYKKLSNLYQELYTIELSQLVLNQNYYELELTKIKSQIKEIENDKKIKN